MSKTTKTQIDNFLDPTIVIISAYVSNNNVDAVDLPVLIRSVHETLESLQKKNSEESLDNTPQKPTAAQIRKSLTPDYIVSFLDGKKYKTMKRHLTRQGFNPESYRQQFGLPSNYPMVASNYASHRSAIAKGIGLGQLFGGKPESRNKAS